MLPTAQFASGTLPADVCGAARRAGIVRCVGKAASATARHSECDNHGRMGGRGDKLAGKICRRRALREDPNGNGTLYDDMNLYAYTENNPTNWTDPLGLYTLKK